MPIVFDSCQRAERSLVFLGRKARLVEKSEPWDDTFVDDPWVERRVGSAPGLVGLVVDEAVHVRVSVELLSAAPASVLPKALYVREAPLVVRGELVLVTGGLDEPRDVPVPEGSYVARVTKLSHWHFLVQLFPGALPEATRGVSGLPESSEASAVVLAPTTRKAQKALVLDDSATLGARFTALVAIGLKDTEAAEKVLEAYDDVEDRSDDLQSLIEMSFDELEKLNEEDEDEEDEDEEDEDEEDEDEEDEDQEDDDDEASDDAPAEDPRVLLDLTGTEALRAALGELASARDVPSLLAQCNEVRAYHHPDERPFFELVATTWGAFPRGRKLGELSARVDELMKAHELANAVAKALRGVVCSSDTDVPYFPFVAEAEGGLDGLRKALGLAPEEQLLIERPAAKRDGRSARDNLFYAHSEDVRKSPKEYHSGRDLRALASADALLRAASREVAFVRFEEDSRYTTTPLFALASLPGGFVAGVVTFGSWT
jgi:hypothetical protein